MGRLWNSCALRAPQWLHRRRPRQRIDGAGCAADTVGTGRPSRVVSAAHSSRGRTLRGGTQAGMSLALADGGAARASVCMLAGPTVESAASLAHTGQVVRVKTKGQTFFLECAATDTPVQLITRLKDLGHVSPQPFDLHFGASAPARPARPVPLPPPPIAPSVAPEMASVTPPRRQGAEEEAGRVPGAVTARPHPAREFARLYTRVLHLEHAAGRASRSAQPRCSGLRLKRWLLCAHRNAG